MNDIPWEGVEKLSEPSTGEEKIIFGGSGSGSDRFLSDLSEVFKKSDGIKVTEATVRPPTRRIDRQKLFLAYTMDETSFRCVNFYVGQVVGPDFVIISDNQKVVEVLETFKEETNLKQILEQVVKDQCVFGNGWIENIYNSKGEVVNLCYTDGRWMDFIRDNTGTVKEDSSGQIEGYVWKDYSSEGVLLEPRQMNWFPLFKSGNELAYGYIEPLFHVIYSKMNARKGIVQAAWRAGNGILIGKVGDKPDNRIGYAGHKSTVENINKLANELEDIENKHNMTMPYWCDISQLNPAPITNYLPLLNNFDIEICGGFGVPKVVAFGEGTISRSDLEIIFMRDLDRRIRDWQQNISNILKDNIFKILLEQHNLSDEKYEIRWNEITPMDLNRKAKRLQTWIELGILNPSDVREMVLNEEGLVTKDVEKELSQEGKENLDDINPIKEKGLISIERSVLVLKALKNTFTNQKIGDICDKLMELLLGKTTGVVLPEGLEGKEELKNLIPEIDKGNIPIERVITVLKSIKQAFPDDMVVKMCDELVQMIVFEVTGVKIPQETSGLDTVQEGDM